MTELAYKEPTRTTYRERRWRYVAAATIRPCFRCGDLLVRVQHPAARGESRQVDHPTWLLAPGPLFVKGVHRTHRCSVQVGRPRGG